MWALGDRVDGRFELLRRTAIGGTATVFRALDHATGAEVALKLLRATTSADHTRAEREARWLAATHDPHVVAFVAAGPLGPDQRFLAMEWIAGETLAERFARQELQPREAVDVAIAIARGLEALHALGAVHRDVKPSNVMLPSGALDAAKLLDFGIARSEPEVVTATGALVGTPGYMAPEQIRGEPVSPATDVFALGCVLYRCLAGRAPFSGGPTASALTRTLHGLAVPLDELRPDLEPTLLALVARAMHVAPSDRFADARTMRTTLEAIDRERLGGAARGLGLSERALASRVVVRDVTHVARDPDATEAADDDALRELGVLARAWGGVASRRADGALEARIEGLDASELVAAAARLAHEVIARWPEARVSLATGVAIRDEEESPTAERTTDTSEPRARVRLDATSARLLDERFAITRVDHALLLGPEHTTTTVVTPRGPFEGRARELLLLDGVLARHDDGTASAAVLLGPTGVGKTRLLREALVRRLPTRVLHARADALARRAPFGVAADLARALLGLGLESSAELRRERVDDWVSRRAPAEHSLRVLLGHLVGAAPTHEASERNVVDSALPSDPMDSRNRAPSRASSSSPRTIPLRLASDDPARFADAQRDAFVALLEGETRDAPLWLVIDDLQWADAASTRALHDALHRLSERPLGVLVAGRPEARALLEPPWPNAIQITLHELPERAASELVRRLWPEATDAQRARIVAHAGGNPLFLHELVDAARRGDEGLPTSVLAIAQARLLRLAPDARRVARGLSILAAESSLDALAAMLAVPPSALDAPLDALEQAGVVQRRGFGDDARVAFAGPVLQEAAYAMLDDADRRAGHRVAAEWHAARPDTPALRLAEHWLRAEEAEPALEACVRAASDALRAADWDAPLELLARARALGVEPERLVPLELVAHEALAWRGDHAELVALSERLLEVVPRGGEAWSRVAAGLLTSGGPSLGMGRALELLRAIASTPLPRPPTLAHVRAHAWASMVCFRAGGTDIASVLLDQLLATREDLGDDPAQVGWVELAALYRPRFVERDAAAALRHVEAAALAFERSGDRFGLGLALAEMGYELLALGRPDAALARLVDAWRVADEARSRTVLAYTAAVTALALARVGRADEAAGAAERAIELADATHGMVARIYARHVAAMVALDADRATDAARWVEVARAIGEAPLPHRPWIDATDARARLALGDLDAAVRIATRAAQSLDAAHVPDLAELWILGAHALALRAASHPDAEHALGALRTRVAARLAELPEALAASYRTRPELRPFELA
jgi:tetratricopeptide (TPR) repeat protein